MPLSISTPAFQSRMDWIGRMLSNPGYFLRADLCEQMGCDMSTASFAISRYREAHPDRLTHMLAVLEGGELIPAGRKHGGQWYFVRPELVP